MKTMAMQRMRWHTLQEWLFQKMKRTFQKMNQKTCNLNLKVRSMSQLFTQREQHNIMDSENVIAINNDEGEDAEDNIQHEV